MRHGEVANGTIEFTCLQRQSELDKEFRNVSLHRKLLGGWGISLSEAIKHLLETGQELVWSRYFCGIGIHGQSNRLANGCDCTRDASSLDLFSLTVVACTDSPCKACEEADSVSERGVL